MIVYYLDASAWVKRYYQEPGSSWVRDLFRQLPRLACSSLGFVEVVATLARKAKAHELDRPALVQRIQGLEEDWGDFIQVHLTSPVLEIARDVAITHGLRGADAVHLACALLVSRRLAAEDDQVAFVTSDQELKDAAKPSGLIVLDPEEGPPPVPAVGSAHPS